MSDERPALTVEELEARFVTQIARLNGEIDQIRQVIDRLMTVVRRLEAETRNIRG